MAKRQFPPAPPGYRYIFRAWKIDPKTDEKIWAKSRGLKAFCFLIPDNDNGASVLSTPSPANDNDQPPPA